MVQLESGVIINTDYVKRVEYDSSGEPYIVWADLNESHKKIAIEDVLHITEGHNAQRKQA